MYRGLSEVAGVMGGGLWCPLTVTLSRKPYLAKTNMYLVGFWDWCIFVLVQIYYTFLKSNSVHPFQRTSELVSNEVTQRFARGGSKGSLSGVDERTREEEMEKESSGISGSGKEKVFSKQSANIA